jgi:hypothetical protein
MALNDDKQYPVTPQFVCRYQGAKTGIKCTAPPVFAAAYCARHSGRPDGKAAKLRIRAAEEVSGRALAILGEEGEQMVDILKNAVPVDPGVLLLEEVARCATVVKWLENRIGELDEESLMWEPELLKIKERKESRQIGGDSYTVRRSETRTTVSRYWTMLQEERKLLVRATEAALRSNIEERRVRLAERGVNVLEAAFSDALVKLGLDPHAENVRMVVGAALRQALDAGQGESIFMGASDEPVKVESARTTVTDAEVVSPPPPAMDF